MKIVRTMGKTWMLNEAGVNYLIQNLARGEALSLSEGQLQQVETHNVSFPAGGK